MSQFQIREFGGLRGIHKSGPAGAPCVVLFHGYGADADDLAPLSEYLPSGNKFSWFFPQGPLQVGIGPMMSGRAWFHIDLAELDRAMNRGEHRKLADSRPAGLDRAVGQMSNCLEALRKEYKTIFLGGFSQGSMITSDALILQKTRAERWIILSGSPLDYVNWKNHFKEMEPLPVFWSHGKSDPVLSYDVSEAWCGDLETAGFEVDRVSFNGGHEIPDRVLERLDDFLTRP